MAKRINLQQLPYVREKIRVSQLINRLIKHVNGELELSRTQIRAAEILLKKTLPDLQAVQHSGEVMDVVCVLTWKSRASLLAPPNGS
jgi:hypothetical protein